MRHAAVKAESEGKISTDKIQVRRWVAAVPRGFYNFKVVVLFAGYAVLTYEFVTAAT